MVTKWRARYGERETGTEREKHTQADRERERGRERLYLYYLSPNDTNELMN